MHSSRAGGDGGGEFTDGDHHYGQYRADARALRLLDALCRDGCASPLHQHGAVSVVRAKARACDLGGRDGIDDRHHLRRRASMGAEPRWDRLAADPCLLRILLLGHGAAGGAS